MGRGDAVPPRERRVAGGQGGGLDGDGHPGQRADVVALEVVVGGPFGGAAQKCGHQLEDPRRVAVRLGVADRLLPEQVHDEAAPPPPELVQAGEGIGRAGADNELLGHPADVAPGHPGGHGSAERHGVGHANAEVQSAGHVGAVEVLADMAQDVGVAMGGRKHVHEAEQLSLERGVGHGPLEHPVAPPRHPVDARLHALAQLGDPGGQGGHLVIEGGGIVQTGRPVQVVCRRGMKQSGHSLRVRRVCDIPVDGAAGHRRPTTGSIRPGIRPGSGADGLGPGRESG